MIALKDATVTAESPADLEPGSDLLVKVDRISPSIILNAVTDSAGGSVSAVELLKWNRANPDVLGTALAILAEKLGSELPSALALRVSSAEMLNIMTMLQSIRLSVNTVDKGNLIMNMLRSVRLMRERNMPSTLRVLKDSQNSLLLPSKMPY